MLNELHAYFKEVGAYLPKENPNADPNQERYDPEKMSPPVARRSSAPKSNNKKQDRKKKKNKDEAAS
jgi:hypothetical protein